MGYSSPSLLVLIYMPQFRKNNRPLHQPQRKRRRQISMPEESQKIEISKSVKIPLRTNANTEPKTKSEDSPALPIGTPRERLTDARTEKLPEGAGVETSLPEVQSIERMIDKLASTLETEPADEVQTTTEDPQHFDGISSKHEHLQLLEEELKASHKHSQKLQHEIELLKAEFDAEKKSLEKNISELRRELHRTAPIEDSKFFTLSRELRDAITAIEDLNQPIEDVDVDLNSISQEETAEPSVLKTLTKDTEDIQPVNKTVKRNESISVTKATPQITVEKKSKISGKKKLLMSGASATAIVFLLAYVGYSQLVAEPEVDDKIVSEYLQGGSVAGAESNEGHATDQEPHLTSDQTITMIDNSQKEVSFSDTVWDMFVDEDFGVRLQYPVNTVKLNKTDSSITFQRKNGYIFKIQQVNTALELPEYWKQISANNLEHIVEESTLGNYEALHLILQEETEYPGNRYLVKDEDKILDIWYATPSSAFDGDDVARAEKMLKSFTLL
jgi:hypothetical protein